MVNDGQGRVFGASMIKGCLIMSKTEPNQKLKNALEYHQLGWSVIPSHYINKNGECTCQDENCDSPGKHPMIKWKQYEKRIPTVEEIKTWWNKWPYANIGIITGAVSGIIVLDVDGPEGEETLKNRELNPTPTVISNTGGGGWHYIYKHPGFECRNFAQNTGETILPKVDFRGDGGFIVAPPSVHQSGTLYEWGIPPELTDPADPPEWLIDLIKRQSKTDNNRPKITEKDWQKTLIEGERNNELTKLAGHLIAKNVSLENVHEIIQNHNFTKCSPPLDSSEVEKIVTSITNTHKRKNASKGFKTKVNYFNEKGAFIPSKLAEKLMEKHSFKYIYDNLFVYENGVYKPHGEDLIKNEASKLLGEEFRLNRVNEAIGYIKYKNIDFSLEYEPDPKYINLLNGRLDWINGELQKHNPDNFEMTQLPVEYNPKADCPKFKKYIHSTLDSEVIPLAQEIYGYCLIPYTRFEKAIMLTGTGSNGKSVFLDTLQALLGKDNVSNVELQELEENRFKAAELLGKLANIFSDLDSRGLKSSTMFKTLVTGDYITSERKFGQPFQFKNYARLLFSANELPNSKDRTFAYYRRWLIIPFNKTFSGEEVDRNLPKKLQQPEELSGILNWALKGLQRLFKNKGFTEPEEVKKALEKYKIKNDSVASFIDECAEKDPNGSVAKQAFYQAYKRFCEEQGLRPVSQRKLNESLYQNIDNLDEYRSQGGNGPWCWLGVSLQKYTEEEFLE